jgi:hypothetical protein
MKTAFLAFTLLSIVAIGRSAPADSAKLVLKEENRSAPSGFFLDASIELHWTQDSTLAIEGWKAGSEPMVVAADIELIDEHGQAIPKMLTTGPAPAFITTATLKKGDRRTFPVTTLCGFAITHSGTYSAVGTLRGTSSAGEPVIITLSKISFHVTTEVKKEPNQAPEPTAPSGRGSS